MNLTEVNGQTLLTSVRGDGQSVVFVAGTNMPLEMWDGIGRIACDEAGLRTVAYNARGIAPSSTPQPPYSIQNLVEDAIGIIEVTHSAACHLVGTSLGACVAATVAAQRPDLVRSLVLYVGGSNYRPGTAATNQANIDAFSTGGDAARERQRAGLLESMLPFGQTDETAAAQLLEAFGALMPEGDLTGAIGHQTANLEWATRDNLPTLRQIQAPTLMIANEGDAYFSPNDMQTAAATIPDCEFVLNPGQPHISMDPTTITAVAARIRDFAMAHSPL